MPFIVESDADNLIDEVAASMREQALDVLRVQQRWPFPKWKDGKIVQLRRVKPLFKIEECEPAPF